MEIFDYHVNIPSEEVSSCNYIANICYLLITAVGSENKYTNATASLSMTISTNSVFLRNGYALK